MAAGGRWSSIASVWEKWSGWQLALRLGMTSTQRDAPQLSEAERSEVLKLGYQFLIALTGYEVQFQEGYFGNPPFL
eukprot:2654824-Amphidinium_carterae.1